MRKFRLTLAVVLAAAGSLGVADPSFAAASWHIVASANSTAQDELADVAIVSARDAWAVGDAYSIINGSYQERPLIEHFTGTAWQVVASPAPTGYPYVGLGSVTALAADDVWAVGEYHSAADLRSIRPLAEHYDGSTWSIVPVPQTDPRASFESVSGTSASDVWAVGSTGRRPSSGPTTVNPLAEHYDGKTWSIVPTPVLPQASLSGVVALSPTDVWAVGSQSASRAPLVLHYDGATWTTSALPDPGVASSGWSLTDIAATASGRLWAVGEYSSPDGTTQHSVAAHYSNGTWTVAPLPEPAGFSFTMPASVAASTDGDVWVVGSASPGDQTSTAMALHFDGTGWRLVPPATVNTSSTLEGVAIGSGATLAVGYSSAAGTTAWRTLAEAYS